MIRHQLDLNSSDAHPEREISWAINGRKFSCRQIQHGTEKYVLSVKLCEACTYALPPTPLIFIMETNCSSLCLEAVTLPVLISEGKQMSSLTRISFHSMILFLICMESIEKNMCCDLALSSTVSRLVPGSALPVPSITGYCATCHLQSGLLLRGFPPGCLFVFRGSIKLS